MTLSAKERLRRFYDQFLGDDRVLIVINADPDAIGSAMAVKRLLWRKVAGVAIAHINVVKRPDNIAMIRLLGVQLIHTENIQPDRFSRIVMVDSQPSHHELLSRFQPHVIIDHHPETCNSAPYQDIRPKYGATATILTEYLRAARIKPSAKLATGLFIAIKTDTRNFERQTLMEDLRAFQFLFRHINKHLARKIEQSELRLDFLKYYKVAFQNMRMRKNSIYVHLGMVSTPDICVLIADFFMKIHSVNWSVISGFHDGKLIIVFRNDGLRKAAGTLSKSSFGQIGSAGGHKSMARAEIAVEDLAGVIDPEDEKKLLQWIISSIEKRKTRIPPAK